MINKVNYIRSLIFRKDINLLFDPISGKYYKLSNDSSLDFYNCIMKFNNIKDITTYLLSIYDIDRETIINDLDKWINNFVEAEVSIYHDGWYGVDKGFNNSLDFPIRIEIELTALCNWNCGFCYNVWKLDDDDDENIFKKVKKLPNKNMSFDLAKNILDQCAENGCMVIRYSGGETMLNPDFFKITEYGAYKGFYQVVFTNGHFIDEKSIKNMVKNNIKTVLISIHGDKITHNKLCGISRAYDKSINAMRLCVENNIQVVAEMTLMKENKHLIIDTLKKVYELGVREFQIMRYVSTGKHDEKYEIDISEIFNIIVEIDSLLLTLPGMKVGWPCGQKYCTNDKDYPLNAKHPSLNIRKKQLTGHCEAGLVWASISYDGQLRICPHSNMYFGNTRDNIKNIWNIMTKKVSNTLTPRDTCISCSQISICKGGCHLSHFFHNSKKLSIPIVNNVSSG